MKTVFYKIILALSRWGGFWIFDLTAGLIATGYFLFSRQRRQVSIYFYRALFPQRSQFYAWWCGWRQFLEFTRIFRDRTVGLSKDQLSHRAEGWEPLNNLLTQKKGAIILMSHLGNWELAAHLLKQRIIDTPLLLFMGKRQQEQLEALQKQDLERNHIKILAVDQDGGSPFHLIEGHKTLKQGGLVSLTGDMIWQATQRKITVRFLGHEAYLPESPFMLALLTESPLFVLFTRRIGRQDYEIRLTGPIQVEASTRKERPPVVAKSAQRYADLLEQALRRAPFEWFHFKAFLGKKLTSIDVVNVNQP